MRLTSLIALLLICSGCAQPPVAPVIPDCTLIVVEGLAPYAYCRQSDGKGEAWRIPIEGLNKYKCTTLDGYAAGLNYKAELTSWIKKSCKK